MLNYLNEQVTLLAELLSNTLPGYIGTVLMNGEMILFMELTSFSRIRCEMKKLLMEIMEKVIVKLGSAVKLTNVCIKMR